MADEIEHVNQVQNPKMFMFCENNFNAPKHHAEAICREIIARKPDIHWGTGDLRPMGITDDFCQSLACLEKAGIPFGVSLMIGAPGESPESVAESLTLIDCFSIPLGRG